MLRVLKKIFTNIYVVLFIYVPVLVQAVAFLLLFAEIYRYNLGILVYILEVAVIGAFGYFWAKKFEKRVGFSTYFALFALPIYTLLCANAAFIISGGNVSQDSFYTIAFFSNPTFFFMNFLFIFSGATIYIFAFELLYCAFSIGFALSLKKNALKLSKKPVIILLSIALVLALTLGIQWVYRDSHMLPSSIADIQSVHEGDIGRYYGYYDYDKTALRGEPTLRLKEELPKIDGATALCPIFMSAFEAIYPKDSLQYVYCSTTPLAYERLILGETELIFTAEPSDEQLQNAKDKGVELVFTPIGKEAFVFLTNRENPIKNLSIKEIRQIYTGDITNWKKVGGENEKILAFQRNKNSGSQSAMERYVMRDMPFQKPIMEEFHSSMGGMIEGVANYRNAKNALGYSFRYYASVMNASENIQFLSIEGVAPTIENIKNGSYPFTGDFYIVSTKNISPNGQKLIDWFLSEQGQRLIFDVGYVPIKEF
jgi:phosphate transport system substrate-binding protein